MPTPEEYIDFLILNGAVEVTGVDSATGDFFYRFTEKLADIAPQIYHGMLDEFEKDIMFFWTQGFITMDPTSTNPIVHLSEKAFDEDEIAKLDADQQLSLQELRRMFFIN